MRMHVKSLEPYLAHVKCSISASGPIIKCILLSSLFYSWGSWKRNHLSREVDIGRDGARDSNPGILTWEYRLSASPWITSEN